MSLFDELGLDLETTEDLLDNWTRDVGGLLQTLSQEDEQVVARGNGLDAAGQGLKTAFTSMSTECDALNRLMAEIDKLAKTGMPALTARIAEAAALPGGFVDKVRPHAENFGDRMKYKASGDEDFSCSVEGLPLQVDIVKRAGGMPPVSATLEEFVQKATRYHFSANEDMSKKHASVNRIADDLDKRYEGTLEHLGAFSESIDEAVAALGRAYPPESEWLTSSFIAKVTKRFADQLTETKAAQEAVLREGEACSVSLHDAVEAERKSVEAASTQGRQRIEEGRAPVMATADELDASQLKKSLASIRSCRVATLACSALLPELEIVTRTVDPVLTAG